MRLGDTHPYLALILTTEFMGWYGIAGRYTHIDMAGLQPHHDTTLPAAALFPNRPDIKPEFYNLNPDLGEIKTPWDAIQDKYDAVLAPPGLYPPAREYSYVAYSEPHSSEYVHKMLYHLKGAKIKFECNIQPNPIKYDSDDMRPAWEQTYSCEDEEGWSPDRPRFTGLEGYGRDGKLDKELGYTPNQTFILEGEFLGHTEIWFDKDLRNGGRDKGNLSKRILYTHPTQKYLSKTEGVSLTGHYLGATYRPATKADVEQCPTVDDGVIWTEGDIMGDIFEAGSIHYSFRVVREDQFYNHYYDYVDAGNPLIPGQPGWVEGGNTTAAFTREQRGDHKWHLVHRFHFHPHGILDPEVRGKYYEIIEDKYSGYGDNIPSFGCENGDLQTEEAELPKRFDLQTCSEVDGKFATVYSSSYIERLTEIEGVDCSIPYNYPDYDHEFHPKGPPYEPEPCFPPSQEAIIRNHGYDELRRRQEKCPHGPYGSAVWEYWAYQKGENGDLHCPLKFSEAITYYKNTDLSKCGGGRMKSNTGLKHLCEGMPRYVGYDDEEIMPLNHTRTLAGDEDLTFFVHNRFKQKWGSEANLDGKPPRPNSGVEAHAKSMLPNIFERGVDVFSNDFNEPSFAQSPLPIYPYKPPVNGIPQSWDESFNGGEGNQYRSMWYDGGDKYTPRLISWRPPNNKGRYGGPNSLIRDEAREEKGQAFIDDYEIEWIAPVEYITGQATIFGESYKIAVRLPGKNVWNGGYSGSVSLEIEPIFEEEPTKCWTPRSENIPKKDKDFPWAEEVCIDFDKASKEEVPEEELEEEEGP